MADPQRIHPADVEAPRPSDARGLVPPEHPRSEKGDPTFAAAEQRRGYPPFRRTIPLAPSRPPRKRRGGCCRCLCWTIAAIVILAVAVAATVGILYLVFDPKLPKYSIDRLQITAFSVDPTLTAHASFDVTVTAVNPNKKIGIYYVGGSRLSVWYAGTDLCEGRLPVFYQGHENTTVLALALTGQAQLGSTAMAALRQQQQTGAVPLEFQGRVPVRVKLGALKLWKVTSNVRCNLVVDSLSASAQIKIKTSSCSFKLKVF